MKIIKLLQCYDVYYNYYKLNIGVVDDAVGAKPDEVGIMNGLTINLHLLMVNPCTRSTMQTKV